MHEDGHNKDLASSMAASKTALSFHELVVLTVVGQREKLVQAHAPCIRHHASLSSLRASR